MTSYLAVYMNGARAALSAAELLQDEFDKACQAVAASLNQGGTVFFAGNGGSASDSQHLAAELVGRFRRDRGALASICLNTDTSVLTALANDFGYEAVFARQVEALARSGDVLVLISTSGASPSILRACETARSMGVTTVGLTGPQSSELGTMCDIRLAVGAHDTCHIQEAHIALGQALCGHVEGTIFGWGNEP